MCCMLNVQDGYAVIGCGVGSGQIMAAYHSVMIGYRVMIGQMIQCEPSYRPFVHKAAQVSVI